MQKLQEVKKGVLCTIEYICHLSLYSYKTPSILTLKQNMLNYMVFNSSVTRALTSFQHHCQLTKLLLGTSLQTVAGSHIKQTQSNVSTHWSCVCFHRIDVKFSIHSHFLAHQKIFLLREISDLLASKCSVVSSLA